MYFRMQQATLTFTPPEFALSGQFWGIYALIKGVRVKLKQIVKTQEAWAVGCCEKIKIGIVASINKIKLSSDMGFNKIKKFSKNFNVFDCPQGAKVTENKDFS